MNIIRFHRTRTATLHWIFALALTIAPLGCGEAAPIMPTGDTVPPAGSDQPAPDDGAVSFADDVQPILTANCAVCHSQGGVADQRGIALRLVNDGRARDMLINSFSVQANNLPFVVPGDADGSLLFNKISSDSPPVGAPMPLGGPQLSSDDIDVIQDWINQGALDN